jgi:hypothetical protein
MWQVGGSSGDLGSDGTQQKCLDEMAQELWRQAKAGELTDVEIKLDDGTVLKSHRGVLSARSRVFKGMFLSEMEEAKTGKVKICDVSAPAFKAFLSFVYTGRLLSEACDGSELWGLADIYEVGDSDHSRFLFFPSMLYTLHSSRAARGSTFCMPIDSHPFRRSSPSRSAS